MSDYISREAVEKLLRYCVALERRDKRPCKAVDILMDFYRIPAADVVEVVHGKWIWFEDCVNSGLYCSACHKLIHKVMRPKKKLSNYCPNCGARMDGGDHDAAD